MTDHFDKLNAASKRPQKGRIFISYRRIDTSYAAGRIYDRLVAKFGEDAIFMDVDTIKGGVDFVKVLEDAVQSCDVLIALIGRQWLSIKDQGGKRRLDSPEDFVRIEIATALKRDIRVIPVLVDGVDMPQPSELPENLRALARKNALQVNHHSFNPDVNRLIEHSESALDEAEESRIRKAQALQARREKAAKEKAKREAAEKAAKEKTEREAAEKDAREKAFGEIRKLNKKYVVALIVGVALIISAFFISPLIGKLTSSSSNPNATETGELVEQVWAQHILVNTENEAFQVLDRLNQGDEWIDIAAEVSIDTRTSDQGGDLGWFGRDVMVKEFVDAAFSLDVGEISQPVKTDFGYHIIQVLGQKNNQGGITQMPEFESVPTLLPTVTSLPTEITDAQGASMVLVPAGEFTMGNDNGDDNEKPAHLVYLDSFYIDKHEVTNALYVACVNDGVCDPPTDAGSFSRSTYFDNATYGNYPVINVTWEMANKYCTWRDARLPTEAEWEKAARSTSKNLYPWGIGISCEYANYRYIEEDYCIGDTTEVGSYQQATSPYGAYDMAGNVFEWTADWYAEYPLDAESVAINPIGGVTGIHRVIRSGAWNFKFETQRVTNRQFNTPQFSYYDLGFRCAKDIP